MIRLNLTGVNSAVIRQHFSFFTLGLKGLSEVPLETTAKSNPNWRKKESLTREISFIRSYPGGFRLVLEILLYGCTKLK